MIKALQNLFTQPAQGDAAHYEQRIQNLRRLVEYYQKEVKRLREENRQLKQK